MNTEQTKLIYFGKSGAYSTMKEELEKLQGTILAEYRTSFGTESVDYQEMENVFAEILDYVGGRKKQVVEKLRAIYEQQSN